MITYRAEELAQSGRMLTIFALYVSYTGDDALLVTHFDKIRAVAEWLLYRWKMALDAYAPSDPRHGIIAGGDEGDTYIYFFETHGKTPLGHKYSCHANVYRGFEDLGRVWRAVGTSRAPSTGMASRSCTRQPASGAGEMAAPPSGEMAR